MSRGKVRPILAENDSVVVVDTVVVDSVISGLAVGMAVSFVRSSIFRRAVFDPLKLPLGKGETLFPSFFKEGLGEVSSGPASP